MKASRREARTRWFDCVFGIIALCLWGHGGRRYPAALSVCLLPHPKMTLSCSLSLSIWMSVLFNLKDTGECKVSGLWFEQILPKCRNSIIATRRWRGGGSFSRRNDRDPGHHLRSCEYIRFLRGVFLCWVLAGGAFSMSRKQTWTGKKKLNDLNANLFSLNRNTICLGNNFRPP